MASLDGARIERDAITGGIDRAAELGRELADVLVARGAREILAACEALAGTI